MKKASAVMERWGYVLVAMMCMGVILVSALWTKRQDAVPPGGVQALTDESQRLSEWTPQPSPQPDPMEGLEVLRGYSAAPVYFAETRIWQTHESLDFALPEGQVVTALRGGTVRVEEGAVWTARGDTCERYRGLKEIFVRTGQEITAGAKLGLCGGSVPFEGTGHLCVTFFRNGVPYDFSGEKEP